MSSAGGLLSSPAMTCQRGRTEETVASVHSTESENVLESFTLFKPVTQLDIKDVHRFYFERVSFPVGCQHPAVSVERGCKCLCSWSDCAEAPVSRPTPLYGQPSWWGEEDYGSKAQTSDESHPGKHKGLIHFI